MNEFLIFFLMIRNVKKYIKKKKQNQVPVTLSDKLEAAG